MGKYVNAGVGFLILLIAVMFVLNLLKKAPVIGGAAAAVQNLATEGHV